MRISPKAYQIASSPTLALNEKAKQLKAEGKPVINLGVGEPKNLTPISATNKAKSRLETRQIKYTAAGGVHELKDAIVTYTSLYYGRTPALNNITVTNGAKQAIYNALLSILDHGDEVILLAPYWVSYPEMVKMAGGKPVVVIPHQESLVPNLDDVLAQIHNKTRAIILNSPNNPSGVIYSRDFVRELVKLCELKEIYLIMDDIYHQLVYGDTQWHPGYRYTDRDINSSYILVINGISKTYGMTGFRIGWAIAARELIHCMTNIQSQTTSGVSIVTQDGALGALTGPQSVVSDLRVAIRHNSEITTLGLDKIPGVQTIKPEGAFYCLPNFRTYCVDSMELSQFLLDKAYVAVVPGSVFGMEGYIRISFAGDPDEIDEAIARIRDTLQSPGDQKTNNR